MRYRRKVRADVAAELAAHFEDALKDCKTNEERNQRATRLIADFGDVKLLGVLLRRAKKRCRPLWRTVVARTFQAIGTLILCFVLYCVYISLGEPTISINYIEQATRLARPVVDEGLNAAPLYQKAIDAYRKEPKIQIEREFAWSQFSRTSKYRPKGPSQKIVRTVDLLEGISDKNWIGDLSEEELSLLKQWIVSNTEAVEYFRQAAEKPYCWWHRRAKDNIVIAALMPELNGIRKLSQLTFWHAQLKAYEGDTEAAVKDILACYRTGTHFKGPRSLIEQIVGIAVQAIAVKNAFVILNNQQMDDLLLKRFQDKLEILSDKDFHTIDYTVERFMGLDFIQRCYTDNGSGSGHLIPGRVREYLKLIEQDDSENELAEYASSLAISLVSANRDQMTREFEKCYAAAQRWAQKTPWQLKKENVDAEMGMREWLDSRYARYWPVRVLAPAVTRVSELSYRARAQIEALITTIAVMRYRRAHGDYPESLDRLLEADLLKKLPMDPYSAKPLVYKRTADGFVLYSLGADFDDDGGLHSNWGRDTEGGDYVFWPVDK
jgi:tetratricopeptide (TPR) repeat protein